MSGIVNNDGSSGPHVLLVDDSQVALRFERLMLTGLGLRFAEVSDGCEVPDAVNRCRPDLIVMDVEMPAVDGIEACRRLKANQETRAIPVLIVTTCGDQATIRRAYEAGCDGFLTKPLNKDELHREVKQLLPALSAVGKAQRRLEGVTG